MRKTILFFAVCSWCISATAATNTTDKEIREQVLKLFSATPAVFIENTGQINEPSVRYVFYGDGANIFHTTSGPVFELFRKEQISSANSTAIDKKRSYGIAIKFEGAKSVQPTGTQRQETKINYYIGGDQNKWRQDVATYAEIVYPELYEGIDLHTLGRRSQLKYEFHVSPGADFSQIVIQYEGIEGLSIDKEGNLVVETPLGRLIDDKPFIYQIVDDRAVQVAGRYRLIDKTSYTFEITGKIDAACELVIDPDLVWSSYLGGSASDCGFGVAVDSSGNVFLAGDTASPNFPTLGGFDTSYNGGRDAFVAKVTNSGELVWASYLGGSSNEYCGYGAAVDSSGNIFLTGYTTSTDFPVQGGFDTSHNGGFDVFAAKVTNSGQLVWASYLGGSGDEEGEGIAIDLSGNIFLTGYTKSTNFPTPGGFDTTYNGVRDVLVAKITDMGNSCQLVWASYLGGNDDDYSRAVALDSSGNAFLTGYTKSDDFPTPGGFDTIRNSTDVFIAKITDMGNSCQLTWASYLGGTAGEDIWAINVGSSGKMFLTGQTNSNDFPVPGGFDTSLDSTWHVDAFIAKITDIGNSGQLNWGSYIGGEEIDYGKAVAIDSSGNLFFAGYTRSIDFPTPGGFDTTYNDDTITYRDVFIAKVTDIGNSCQLAWASFLGGRRFDYCLGMVLDSSGNVFLTGETDSNNFPVPGGFDTSHNGSYDALVAKICLQAGKFDVDCDVDFFDYAMLGRAWLTEPNDPNWNAGCDISTPADNVIDILDLAAFVEHWLEGTGD